MVEAGGRYRRRNQVDQGPVAGESLVSLLTLKVQVPFTRFN